MRGELRKWLNKYLKMYCTFCTNVPLSYVKTDQTPFLLTFLLLLLDIIKSQEEMIMRLTEIPEIKNLSLPEKILFVEELWDSIAADEDSIPVPESHKSELDKRFKRYQSDPGALLSLSELQERINKRK